MNWHLSTEDKPSDNDFYAIVFKRNNRYYFDTDYTYFESDETFLRNDDYGDRFELKKTIAWISEDEILNDFREFYKRNNKPASPPTQKQLDFIESICEELDIEFTGTTKEEARQFISSHIDEFELANEAYALEHEDAGDRL